MGLNVSILLSFLIRFIYDSFLFLSLFLFHIHFFHVLMFLVVLLCTLCLASFLCKIISVIYKNPVRTSQETLGRHDNDQLVNVL
jgi:hypothetical protein